MSDQPNPSTLPNSGIYNIVNHSTGKYFDLEVGNVAPNTPILGWTGHGQPNQQVLCPSPLLSLYQFFPYRLAKNWRFMTL
jgi:hypothetical protein